MTKQIRTKERVVNYSEVFTNEKEVKAMCDLVEQEIKKTDSKILEPACGNGNFLIEILKRKLNIANTRVTSLVALKSLYGVELLEDNVEECKKKTL